MEVQFLNSSGEVVAYFDGEHFFGESKLIEVAVACMARKLGVIPKSKLEQNPESQEN